MNLITMALVLLLVASPALGVYPSTYSSFKFLLFIMSSVVVKRINNNNNKTLTHFLTHIDSLTLFDTNPLPAPAKTRGYGQVI